MFNFLLYVFILLHWYLGVVNFSKSKLSFLRFIQQLISYSKFEKKGELK